MQSYSTIEWNAASDLSGSWAGYVNKFHPANLPQQNSENKML